MNEPEQGSGEGWNVAKVFGLIVGLLGMAGFGFCGLCGLVLGMSPGSNTGFVLTCGILGLIVAGVFFLLVRAMIRSARRKPPGAS